MTVWAELNAAAQARMLAVAAAQPPQVLAELRREVERAIETGSSLRASRPRFTALVRRLVP